MGVVDTVDKQHMEFLLAYLRELRELAKDFPNEKIDESILAVVSKLDKFI